MIVAINMYLQAYHTHRAPALNKEEARHREPRRAGHTAEGVSVWRAACGRHPSPVLVHGEAALHGALGENLQYCGPVPHHLRQRHREPDEVGCQDQNEEDQQPGIVGRQHPQGQNGGGGGGRSKSMAEISPGN